MGHVCSHRFVWTFDNLLRPLIHDPRKLFGAFVSPGMRVLDLGCGAGFAALGLARLVGSEGQVVAVDLQPQMLAKVRRRALKSSLSDRIQTQPCTADALGVIGPFDFVNLFYMVHETPDSSALLEQVSQVLHPGGHVFVAEPRFHVSQKAFEAIARQAVEVGFVLAVRPSVRFSHAVVLRYGAHHSDD